MSAILDGVRIVDWTHHVVGPHAAAMLADLGAEVIHVEERERGDVMRGVTHWMGVPMQLPHNRGALQYEQYNRNKKSITVDLATPSGREIIYRLVRQSDVFLTNFRPKAVEKLGMTYEVIREVNSRIIYAEGTAVGLEGPERDAPSNDLVAQARSGAMMASGEEESPPAMIPNGAADRVTGMLLAFGVLAALLHREKSGIAQRVDVSMLGGTLSLMGNDLAGYALLGKVYPRHSRHRAGNPLYNYYRCADGRWLALSTPYQNRDWPAICRVIGTPELEMDPKFVDMDTRKANNEELIGILATAFQEKPLEEWLTSLAPLDVICAPVNTIPDVFNDPQVALNRCIVDWEHPIFGPVKFEGFPVQFSETPATLRTCAPELGQHTEEVLLEICGYSWNEIQSLRDQHVI